MGSGQSTLAASRDIVTVIKFAKKADVFYSRRSLRDAPTDLGNREGGAFADTDFKVALGCALTQVGMHSKNIVRASRRCLCCCPRLVVFFYSLQNRRLPPHRCARRLTIQ
jgi:hypothetical protein